MKHQVKINVIKFQTNRGEWIEVKDVIGIERKYGVIKGSTRGNFLIVCYFKNKPSYPIGYFKDKVYRDLAFNLIKTAGAKSTVSLPYEMFFKYIPIKKESAQKLCSVYPMETLLKNFSLSAYNNNPTINHTLGFEQLQNLRNEKIDKEVDQDALIVGLTLFVKLPHTITNQIHAGAFWKYKINSLCVI
jgi:hypothetical protein